MSFNMKYDIKEDYLPKGSMKRPGNNINVKFIVAHDTGNPGSTAAGNVGYYKRTSNQTYASAHLFSDDKEIIECIPALTGEPERAYHVIYNARKDNEMYGYNSNDAAIGVEMCWGKGIDSTQSYLRYVWTLAYLCHKFNLDPRRDIVGHDTLDPRRKIDPTNALKYMGKTFNQLVIDVIAEYKDCTGETSTPIQKPSNKEGKTHKVVSGDTLWGLANKYDTNVDTLKALNPEISVQAIQVGTTLLIEPKSEPIKATPKYHTIVRGDTFWELSKKYSMSIDELEKLNPKVNALKLVVGEKVVVGYGDTPKVETKQSQPKSTSTPKAKAPVRPYPGKAVKRGAQGNDVKAIQRAIGIPERGIDGKFGPQTERLVKEYQKRKNLVVDGVVGQKTWNVMF